MFSEKRYVLFTFFVLRDVRVVHFDLCRRRQISMYIRYPYQRWGMVRISDNLPVTCRTAIEPQLPTGSPGRAGWAAAVAAGGAGL